MVRVVRLVDRQADLGLPREQLREGRRLGGPQVGGLGGVGLEVGRYPIVDLAKQRADCVRKPGIKWSSCTAK